MDPQAVFANVEHEGAAEVLSRKLAAIELAIMKLEASKNLAVLTGL